MKYYSIFKTHWQSSFVYRLNFVMWRVRTVLQFFAVYFLWLALFIGQDTVFDYTKSTMLTYVLGTAILRSFVFSSRSVSVGAEISSGDLNNYLVKPLSYLKNWLARDLADKLLNIVFLFFEMGLFIIIFKPPLIGPVSLASLLVFCLSAILAMMIYFLFSFLISSFTFWYPEHNGWPLRFFIFIIIEFLAGGLFPLDILPDFAFKLFRLLPPAYLVFYPIQIYLSRLTHTETISAILVMLFWLLVLYQLSRIVWKKGLKIYGAYGR